MYKQILIDAKLKTGKRGRKQNWDKPIKEEEEDLHAVLIAAELDIAFAADGYQGQ